jgi:hypothetical protein
MIGKIICTVCDCVIGTLSKPEITDRDIENISVSVSCDCGGAAALEIQPQ